MNSTWLVNNVTNDIFSMYRWEATTNTECGQGQASLAKAIGQKEVY
jgi:hypothetical protein